MGERFAGAVPYLRAFARVIGADAHLTAAIQGDEGRAKLAAFYIRRILPEHVGLLAQVRAGAEDVMSISPDELAA